MTSAKRTVACGRRGACKTPAAFFFPLQTMHSAGTVLFVWFTVIIIRFPSHCFIPFSLYRPPRGLQGLDAGWENNVRALLLASYR